MVLKCLKVDLSKIIHGNNDKATIQTQMYHRSSTQWPMANSYCFLYKYGHDSFRAMLTSGIGMGTHFMTLTHIMKMSC